LDVWNLGIQIYQEIHQLLCSKKNLSFKISAQIEDAALSMSRNIAEGYARRTLKENLRFYEIATASSTEVYSQLYALNQTQQISDVEFKGLDDKLYEFENKMIAMNKRLIEKLKTGSDWKEDYQ
jgi:four helix bundle protein